MTARSVPIVTIRPSRSWVSFRLDDLWEYRELLFFLVWRDVKIRYKQTALGATWAVLQPFCTMVVFSIFFGRFAKIPSDNVPYPVFAFCALLPWQLFAFTLTESSNSVVASGRLISKVYFPRLILPMAAVGVALIDFAIAFLVLLGLMIYYGLTPGLAVFSAPIWMLLAVATALAVGVWLSALNVRYRDVRFVVPFVAQLWMFASPVAYPTSIVPEAWRPLYALNPMVGVIEGFRSALLGTPAVNAATMWRSSIVLVLVLATGLVFFRRTERTFADLL